MDKKFFTEQEEKLREEKKKLEDELRGFAKETPQVNGDWEANMPLFNSGSGNLEEEADEVEEFSTNLALTNNLESELQDVNLALGKIKKGQYGICEKCQKNIPLERLKVYPKARYCTKCPLTKPLA